MSKRGDEELLRDIQEAIKRTLGYTKNIDYPKFTLDIKTQDAVIRNLEIIGEASKNISKNLTSKHPQMAWNDLAKVRDKLIHHYFGVNLDIVWNIIEESLPKISVQIEEIIADKNR
ncbi:MAG: DUF86 domain-containing protein [Candidatus Omnitrophica bacterium]|nr:DUF86 domain-containing protein [Candidatus Omnitrophota bacterium]